MSEKEATPSNVESMMETSDPVANMIVRSAVPAGLPYRQYKRYLRHDFYYSCAYCTTMESEATAIRMVIDHYEPVVCAPALANDYNNLMYACEPCNLLKSDRFPPAAAQAEGHRFFRPDLDVRLEHFRFNGVLVESDTNVGNFTITFMDLNRRGLQRIRELRSRLIEGSMLVSEGIMALRSFPLDQISQEFRSRAHRFIDSVLEQEAEYIEDIDSLLRAYAKSPLIEDEESAADIAEKKERVKALRKGQGMYEGAWSGRSKKKGKKR